MHTIRPYRENDYEAVKSLYLQGELYGGQFDEARDGKEKLAEITRRDPQSLLVCETNGEITGTISLIENGRVAWLFRFAVVEGPQAQEIARALHAEARKILAQRGHTQMLVYTAAGDAMLETRYRELGMTGGNVFRCFWEEIS